MAFVTFALYPALRILGTMGVIEGAAAVYFLVNDTMHCDCRSKGWVQTALTCMPSLVSGLFLTSSLLRNRGCYIE